MQIFPSVYSVNWMSSKYTRPLNEKKVHISHVIACPVIYSLTKAMNFLFTTEEFPRANAAWFKTRWAMRLLLYPSPLKYQAFVCEKIQIHNMHLTHMH